MSTTVRTRRRVVVDHTELAKAIGTRIRAARLAAGLTQQELAGDRYTKAYVSALELGHAKPSMAALDYLAPRLGTRPDRLIGDDSERWTRLDADLHLAAGRFDQALEAFHALASRERDKVRRGELLLGAGEAAVRARRFAEGAGVGPLQHPLLVAADLTADTLMRAMRAGASSVAAGTPKKGTKAASRLPKSMSGRLKKAQPRRTARTSGKARSLRA